MRRIKLCGNTDKSAMVDNDQFKELNKFKWFLTVFDKGGREAFYAMRKPTKTSTVYLHRQVMKLKPGDPQVDHRDFDGLNCQRKNLRVAGYKNQQNKRKQQSKTQSIYKGVCLSCGKSIKWRAFIRVNGKGIYLGTFLNEEDAARVYDKYAKKYFGTYACLNFPKTKQL